MTTVLVTTTTMIVVIVSDIMMVEGIFFLVSYIHGFTCLNWLSSEDQTVSLQMPTYFTH